MYWHPAWTIGATYGVISVGHRKSSASSAYSSQQNVSKVMEGTDLQTPFAKLIVVALHGLEHARNDLGEHRCDLRRRGARDGRDEMHSGSLLLEVGIRGEEGKDMRCEQVREEVALRDGDELRKGDDGALADDRALMN